MKHPYLRHLASAASLITAPASWRALGATSVVEERRSKRQLEADARTLSYKAEQAKTPYGLLHMPAIEGGLLTAAGVKREDAVRLDRARWQQIVVDFVELESGELSNAANLTDDRQAVSLVSWLCNL